ncbi:hypothetical protein FOZ62_022916 [Perkinsus olseni]|uniref:Aspartate/homoserine dehydrogenase NAD-binding domain-containing protein n=1 Tax=Perkinsus olseni TaxID=32597 RepID=A0A7J6UD34_PEROL|nr:hypothetical protein FOZ62_022916 [Perkinsus olseni]
MPSSPPEDGKVRVAMLGFGVVGGGVVELLKPYDRTIALTKICVRDPSKSRDVELPQTCEVVTDPHAILNDESIDIVVEVMGGTDSAWTYTEKALKSGKSDGRSARYLTEVALGEMPGFLVTLGF